MKKLVLVFLLIIAFNASYGEENEVFYPGEELVYEVSFLGINLGEVKVFAIEKDIYEGKEVYYAKATMQSNPSIPYASLSAIFESWMSPNMNYAYKFEGNTKFGSDGDWVYQKMLMNYEEEKIKVERWIDRKKVLDHTLETTSKANDGCSLFFLAREYVDSKKRVKVPTIIDKTIDYTYINFWGRKEEKEIDAVDYPIKTVYFDGRADWKGIYGLNGEFEGWFTDDEANIPVKARMQVYVGSVDLELIRWDRGSWQPPKWEK